MFLSLVLAITLSLTHLFAGYLRFLRGIPRSRWLSIAGGISVAYVFLRLLPELDAGQEAFRRELPDLLSFFEHHAYLLALVGLVVFYGLERVARVSRQKNMNPMGEGHEQALPGNGIFWLHIAAFSVYNFLIGYLLVAGELRDLVSKALFSIAMALHFVVIDYGLRELHKHVYQSKGRWVLSGAVLVGWATGSLTSLPHLLLIGTTAFLSGGMILNVMKEELPEERESRFLPFLLGALFYSIILLIL